MTNSMRVLITNFDLAGRGGTQMYVRDLAAALLARGHQPVVYSTEHGSVAAELRAATIPVVSDLDKLSTPPDIIHGNQHVETMTALLRYPGVPAVYFCHSWRNWLEAPPAFPRIVKYIAVDHTCRDRLTIEHGIPESKVRVILNFVDLERFKPRGALPNRPQRALVFSNYADEHTYLKTVREACARTDVALDVIGEGVGNVCAQPELELGKYDIVFAKARAALEALAVGTAVVLCDAVGSGTLVTSDELPHLRRLNFGVRTLQGPITTAVIAREIARYDPADAAEVSRQIRATAGLDLAVAQIIELYEEVIAQWGAVGQVDIQEEGRAAAAYLRQLYSDFKSHAAFSERMRSRVRKIPLFGSLLLSLRNKSTTKGFR